MADYVVAFDTANEIIAVGVGRLHRADTSIEILASSETEAFRASNTKLVACVEETLGKAGITQQDVACVVCGRGPGSFTGVRICMATAKGMAIGLNVPLFGVSTADAQAFDAHARGCRGSYVVLGDAMRKEVYPVRYVLTDEGIERTNTDIVMKAADAVNWLGRTDALISGDALKKYADLFAECGTLASPDCWHPTGAGLLLAAQAQWRSGRLDPDDAQMGNAATLLPVYTRLSDAEEAERTRLAKSGNRDLQSGVQGSAGQGADAVSAEGTVIRYQPLDASWVDAVAAMEANTMGTDAWNAALVADELPRADRTWWAAYELPVEHADVRTVVPGVGCLVGYAGGWIVDGQLQILKVATDPTKRRRGIARELLAHLANDARDLGAQEATLEVRVSNTGARALYENLGMVEVGVRPHYYSDREDACIYTGPLPVAVADVAGMDLRINEAVAQDEPSVGAARAEEHDADPAAAGAANLPETLILAIESSCDETAVAIVDGQGAIIADVVASQIDFHSRFGGVVPEIASRKHIEAIGGVVQVCLEQAREALNAPALDWRDFSAIGVTYAPGLVGALVVGLAFAKGLAFSAQLPLVCVNHLEGHIYANKLACPDIQPPMVVSLVSGGHTMLVHVRDWGSYTTLGSTLDDAVGEAFDKVAKAMGLGYPGGPIISALAAQGNPKAIKFPRALLHSGDMKFSLSGLKTSVMTYLQKEAQQGREVNKQDVAASFQAAVIDVQIAKARMALEETGAKEFCLGGGVAANPALRAAYEELCAEMGVRLTMPPLSACTDNAAMIALVALDRFNQKRFAGMDCDVCAHAPLDESY